MNIKSMTKTWMNHTDEQNIIQTNGEEFEWGTVYIYFVMVALRSHHVWKYGRNPICDG